jgi:putative hemolysin
MLNDVGAISLDQILRDRLPAWNKIPRILHAGALALVRRLTRIDDVEALVASQADKRGATFIDGLFEDLGFSYVVSDADKARIPAAGRIVVVANHPLGAMDALALLRTVLGRRSDVRVVANEILMQVDGLAGHFLPFDMFAARPRKSHVAAFGRALEREEALVMFPSGEVSRLTASGVRDRTWLRGAAHLAHKHHAPLLPVFIGGRNSWVFYVLSFMNRTVTALLLPRQILHQRGRTIRLTIGDPIPATMFARATQVDALRTHIYTIGQRAAHRRRQSPSRAVQRC